jgi:hypothetical protein
MITRRPLQDSWCRRLLLANCRGQEIDSDHPMDALLTEPLWIGNPILPTVLRLYVIGWQLNHLI